ncbi:site-specific integrase [Listeria booriae]|uniref:tyrosine-type recombinase/integrase n=1 Tax=Listeria booriae TaxID=1552123 RepID=UPI00164E55F1|nr:tyrosine-type recombinase/integrase [Listeria booriae]MBC6134270.1 site-specific integrase [Listeria booriae]
MARFFGTIEKQKTNWRMRVTTGYKENGTPIRASRTTTTKNAAQREKELAAFIAELERGEYIAPSKMTYQQFIEEEYIPKQAKHQQGIKAFENRSSHFKNHIFPRFGQTQISKISTLQIVTFLHDLQQEGVRTNKKDTRPLSVRTVCDIFKMVRTSLETAKAWGIIKSNPCDLVKLPSSAASKVSYYTPEEVDFIYSKLADEPLDFQMMICIAICTGCRVGELAALERKHLYMIDRNAIKFENTIITPTGIGVQLKESTKNETTGYVSIPTWLSEMLKIYLSDYEELRGSIDITSEFEKHEFIFYNLMNGKPLRPDSIYQRWIRFLARNKIRHLKFHALRHTSATLLIKENVHLKVIQQRLRHKKHATTADIYSHVLVESDDSAASTFKKPF